MVILLWIILAPIIYLVIGAIVAGTVLYLLDAKTSEDIGGGCVVILIWPIFVLLVVMGGVVDVLTKVFK